MPNKKMKKKIVFLFKTDYWGLGIHVMANKFSEKKLFCLFARVHILSHTRKETGFLNCMQ